MNKQLAMIVVMGAGLSACAQQTVQCASTNGQRQVCAADTHNGVLLLRDRSNGVCQQGTSWSYNRAGISVSRGCVATFLVNDGRTNQQNADNGYGGNGYGQDGQRVDGDHRDDRNRQNQDLVIPANTEMTVRLEQAVRMQDVNQNDVIPATLVSELTANGRIIAPVGTPVQARVTSQRGAPLDLSLDNIVIEGQSYALRTTAIHSERDSRNANNDNQNSLGAVFGALLGNQELRQGTIYTFQLVAPAQPVNQ